MSVENGEVPSDPSIGRETFPITFNNIIGNSQYRSGLGRFSGRKGPEISRPAWLGG
jgi:hypothetical protein